jgi:predicted transcriptional regulator
MYKSHILSNIKNGDTMIEKIMTKKIIFIKNTDTVKTACKKMLEFDIGFLPVTKDNKVIGVITDRDIATKIFSNTSSSKIKIESYISRNMISCEMDSSIEEALFLMKEHHIKRLLIVDNQKVVGILSFSDILHHIDNTELLMSTLKTIFRIDKNINEYKTEIDEFYL